MFDQSTQAKKVGLDHVRYVATHPKLRGQRGQDSTDGVGSTERVYI